MCNNWGRWNRWWLGNHSASFVRPLLFVRSFTLGQPIAFESRILFQKLIEFPGVRLGFQMCRRRSKISHPKWANLAIPCGRWHEKLNSTNGDSLFLRFRIRGEIVIHYVLMPRSFGRFHILFMLRSVQMLEIFFCRFRENWTRFAPMHFWIVKCQIDINWLRLWFPVILQ